MNLDAAAQIAIRARLILRAEREKAQGQLLVKTDDYAETVRIKLSGLLQTNQFYNFERCGHEEIYRTCENCGTVESFNYRCNLKWCPRCQQRLTQIRRGIISLWAKKIKQPKHLVLTHKNFPTLTRRIIREHTVKLAKFRRAKVMKRCSGGCCSTEITNEGNGWHLHAHMLLDVKWLDMEAVAITWGRLVGQHFAIVKIKDVREKSYLQEICKYVVEGSELAKWEPDEINEFVQAIRGLRMFNSFGTLRDLAPQIRREIFATKPPSPKCKCGCGEFIYESEETSLAREAGNLKPNNSVRPHSLRICGVEQPVAAATFDTPAML
jgi:hypothetical protein